MAKNISNLIQAQIKDNIYLNDDYYNELVEKIKKETEKWYDLDTEKARLVRSFYMGFLIQLQKISACICSIKNKLCIDKAELTEAYNFLQSIFDNLILNSGVFDTATKDKRIWLQDCKTVLSRGWHTSKEVVDKMGQFWGLKSSRTIYARLKTITTCFETCESKNKGSRKMKRLKW